MGGCDQEEGLIECPRPFEKGLVRRKPAHASVTAHCRAKRQHLQISEGLSPGSQGHNLAVAVLCVPSSLDSGQRRRRSERGEGNLEVLTVDYDPCIKSQLASGNEP